MPHPGLEAIWDTEIALCPSWYTRHWHAQPKHMHASILRFLEGRVLVLLPGAPGYYCNILCPSHTHQSAATRTCECRPLAAALQCP